VNSYIDCINWSQSELPYDKGCFGNVGLGEKDDDMQVFYCFGKSKNNPLVLWLTGDPACPSFSGLAFQLGNFLDTNFVC